MKLIFTALLCLFFTSQAHAEDSEQWYLQTSLLTAHYESKPHHNNDQALLGLEYYPETEADTLVGLATFRNSFDQRSVYGYAGRRFHHSRWPVYAKITAGLIYGYRGEGKDAVPLNRFGVAPVILPSVGLSAGQFSSELVVLANAGLMVNIGVAF